MQRVRPTLRSTARLILVFIALSVQSAWAAPQAGASGEGGMRQVYQAFRELHPLIAIESEFRKEGNRGRINQLLSHLEQGLHGVDSLAVRYSSAPGFEAQLASLKSMLREAGQSFKGGDVGWAHWQLRTVANHCQSCHTSYDVGVRFYDPKAKLEGLNDFERGEFYLATRQFALAKDAFLRAATKPPADHYTLEALRKWLIIYIRVNKQPEQAIIELQRILKKNQRLTSYDQREIGEWLKSLKRWRNQRRVMQTSIENAEALMHDALISDQPLYSSVGAVELLRSTAMLHELLQHGRLPAGDVRRALYLLGMGYSKLRLYFANELPEFYLENCIRRFPKTQEARLSYQLYRETMLLGYTGSRGTHLPDDLKLKLSELHDLAYGAFKFENRI